MSRELASPEESERRVLTDADRFAIEQQIYRYGHSYDSGDAQSFVQVFTDDGIGEAIMLGETELFSHLEGSDEIRAFAEAGREMQSLHHTTSILFDEINESSAKTRSAVLATRQIDNKPVIVTHGVYHDEWRKTPDGWRIARRLYESHGYRTV
jgi:ketosteroid isomerase-like protein